MMRIDEAGLAAYVKQWQDRTGRTPFSATVLTVNGAGPYELQVQRQGESEADPHTHICALPSYLPAPGDRVMMIPLDGAHAYVAFPLGSAFLRGTGSAKIDDQSPSVSVPVFSIRIPQTGVFPLGYSSIKMRYDIRTVSANQVDEIHLQYSGDTGGHYDSHYFGAQGASAVTPAQFLAASSHLAGFAAGGAAAGGHFNGGTIEIINYTSQLTRIKFAGHCVRTDSSQMGQQMFGGEWTLLAGTVQYITLFTFTGLTNTNMAVGSRVVTEVIP